MVEEEESGRGWQMRGKTVTNTLWDKLFGGVMLRLNKYSKILGTGHSWMKVWH